LEWLRKIHTKTHSGQLVPQSGSKLGTFQTEAMYHHYSHLPAGWLTTCTGVIKISKQDVTELTVKFYCRIYLKKGKAAENLRSPSIKKNYESYTWYPCTSHKRTTETFWTPDKWSHVMLTTKLVNILHYQVECDDLSLVQVKKTSTYPFKCMNLEAFCSQVV